LCNGDYKDTVKEQPGSASVVQGVSEDRNAAGYSGIGYMTSGVRAVPLATKDGEPYQPATYENVVTGKYPLSRFLFVYINRPAGQAADPLVREFVKFIFSKEGQEVVLKDGYYPVTAAIAKEEIAKVE
jgi:phosphate transport system substrate-binding protein